MDIPQSGASGIQARALTVTELNHQARHLLETSFMQVWVEGELSSFSRPSSGHWYFSLKDDRCQVRCAMFRGFNQKVRAVPREGDQVRLRVRVSLYENRGDYQLIVEHMEPAGLGALQRAFEELKAKLAKEGLFEQGRKKTIPEAPSHIGVITSPTGAAIHDILSVLKHRCPGIRVTLYPTPVQGKEAISGIVSAIALAERHGEADVLIVGRGGGSLEDLWAFNEEAVARAIADCRLPTVSAVGHEVDFTIADFVADLRAPTPSAAAERLSPDQHQWLRRLADTEQRFAQVTQRYLLRLSQQVDQLGARLKSPQRQLLEQKQRLQTQADRLGFAMRQKIATEKRASEQLRHRLSTQTPRREIEAKRREINQIQQYLARIIRTELDQLADRLASNGQQLNLVSPLATLGRGYAIVRDCNGQVVRDASLLQKGDRVSATVARGKIEAEIVEIASQET